MVVRVGYALGRLLSFGVNVNLYTRGNPRAFRTLHILKEVEPNPAMHRRLIQRPRDAFQIVNFLMQPQLITDTEGSHDRRRLGSI